MKKLVILSALFISSSFVTNAQPNAPENMRPEETEYYAPIPPVIKPGASFSDAPSDAIILFDGKNLKQWISTKDSTAAKWTVTDNIMTVSKTSGDIQTKRTFTDYQLHIEYRIPENITGSGLDRPGVIAESF